MSKEFYGTPEPEQPKFSAVDVRVLNNEIRKWKALAGELLTAVVEAEESNHGEICGEECSSFKEHINSFPIFKKAKEAGL